MRPNKNKLTRRQKLIATATYPTYGRYSTWDEVWKAKRQACGSYWHENDFYQWVAFSPGGRRIFYDYDIEWKNDVKMCAKLVAEGRIKEADSLYESFFDNHCFKHKC